jgi:putative flippase GtrA
MDAKISSDAGLLASRSVNALRNLLQEGARYFIASAIALAIDAGAYVALIRLGRVDYLVAAPIGYALGIAVIYVLSIRWVFGTRRLNDERSEFLLFALIGITGLLMNQLVIYVCVEALSATYEVAKLTSAVLVFGANFGGRKLLLFTRY